MIYDKTENMSLYFANNEKFKKVLEAYNEFIKNPFENGKIEIIPEKIWCNVSKYETKSPEGAKYESHRKFCDVQVMFDGEEIFGWAPFDECTVTDPFGDGDCAFMTSEHNQFFDLKKGYFAVFFPQDAHMPCLQSENSKTAHKLVFKVEL